MNNYGLYTLSSCSFLWNIGKLVCKRWASFFDTYQKTTLCVYFNRIIQLLKNISTIMTRHHEISLISHRRRPTFDGRPNIFLFASICSLSDSRHHHHPFTFNTVKQQMQRQASSWIDVMYMYISTFRRIT